MRIGILHKSIAAILILALFTGCQKKNNEHSDSALVTAYKLIDDKREDEAIYLLEQELARAKSDSAYAITVQVAMASAYAHKAGFKVQKFASLLSVSKSKLDFSVKPAVRNNGKTAKAEAVDVMIRSVGILISSFRVIMDYYTAIPTVKPEDEVYLNYAIRIMDNLGDRLTPGQSLYRAILKVVFLKNYLAAHVFDDGLAVNLDIQACDVDFKKIKESLEKTTQVSISIIDDIAKAQPSKAEGMSHLRKQLGNSLTDLTLVASSASLLDETSMMFTKNAIAEAGLRNLLKCHARGVPLPVSQ